MILTIGNWERRSPVFIAGGKATLIAVSQLEVPTTARAKESATVKEEREVAASVQIQ